MYVIISVFVHMNANTHMLRKFTSGQSVVLICFTYMQITGMRILRHMTGALRP